MKLEALARGGGGGVGKISMGGGGWDFNEAGGNNFRGQNALRNLLGPKGHLIIDSNSAKTITV